MTKIAFTLTGLLSATLISSAANNTLHSFKKIQLTDKFWSEGAYFGDFNHDGNLDIVSGPFWYEGPDFKKQHEYCPATAAFARKTASGSEEKVPGFEGGLGTKTAYSE